MNGMFKKSFASDNYAPAHPRFLAAIERANHGHQKSYGADEWTRLALLEFENAFERHADIFFVFNGTAANVLSLQSGMRSYSSIICTEWAHIHNDECGAPEKFLQAKLHPVPSKNGKLTVQSLEHHMARRGDQHAVQPAFVSLSQSTEYGTIYSVEEILEISQYCRSHSLYLHMDGARISNAAAALKLSLKEFTWMAGIDILSFGGTKAGLMFGEAIVIFNSELTKNFQYYRKQGMQLASKMRFISAQFLELLKGNFFLELAGHSNQMAQLLKTELAQVPGVELTQLVQANAVFVRLPTRDYASIQEKYPFYIWNASINEARLMCSWDTQESDVRDFVKQLRVIVEKR
jgi:threonine aldolase